MEAIEHRWNISVEFMISHTKNIKAAINKSNEPSYSHMTIRLVTVIAILMVMTVVPEGHAESDSVLEYKIKAAFLYSFAKFIDWPEQAFSNSQSPIILGVLGEDPFGLILNELEGKVAKGRSIVAYKYSSTDSFDELKLCHIIFVCSSEKERFTEIIEMLKDTNVLLVGDMEGFAQLGGIINFILVEKKVRFEINVAAAERAGLKISSKLLTLAKIVVEEKLTEGN